MSRKFVLPFLLGLKFNLATLLPLILGAIILISKKAAFLSKLALFISGLFGIGGIASLGALGGGLGGGGHGYGYYSPPIYQDPGLHHAGVYKILENNTPRTQDEPTDHFYDYDRKQLKDRSSRLYERELDQEKRGEEKHAKYKPTNQRNFVWATSNPN